MARRVMITGGASGLGRALAARYLREGARVLITDVNVGRGEDTVRELSGQGDITFLQADTTKDADWQALLDWVGSHFEGLDILINNAGVASIGRIENVSMEEWDRIIEVNLKGVVRGCRTFVPLFKEQRSGHIVNIASLAAVTNGPNMGSYNATKSAVVSLSETLRFELMPYGVKTTVACPSFFATNIGESLRTSEPALEEAVQHLLETSKLTAEDIAEKIVRAVTRGRFLVLPHPEGRVLHLLKRYMPLFFERGVKRVAYQLYQRIEERE